MRKRRSKRLVPSPQTIATLGPSRVSITSVLSPSPFTTAPITPLICGRLSPHRREYQGKIIVGKQERRAARRRPRDVPAILLAPARRLSSSTMRPGRRWGGSAPRRRSGRAVGVLRAWIAALRDSAGALHRLEECLCAAAESGGAGLGRGAIDAVRPHVRDAGDPDHCGELTAGEGADRTQSRHAARSLGEKAAPPKALPTSRRANVLLETVYWADHNARFAQAPTSADDFHVARPRGVRLDHGVSAGGDRAPCPTTGSCAITIASAS